MPFPLLLTFDSPSSPISSISRICLIWICFSPPPWQPLSLTWTTVKLLTWSFLSSSSIHIMARGSFKEHKLDHVIALNKAFQRVPIPISSSWLTRPCAIWPCLCLQASLGPSRRCWHHSAVLASSRWSSPSLHTLFSPHFTWLAYLFVSPPPSFSLKCHSF